MEIKGIIAAMATAMHDDGSINEQEIRRQVNRHIAAGVDGVFCLGTNGEFYILSAEEKKQVMRICVDGHGAGCPSMPEPAVWERRTPLTCPLQRRRLAWMCCPLSLLILQH